MSKLHDAFIDEVKRALKTLRVRGWTFADPDNIGMRIVSATPLRRIIEAHIDQCTRGYTITERAREEDLARAAEKLVIDWHREHHGKALPQG